ncbi:MAG: hypothetical protein ACOVNL_05680 [Prochlorococcaceae cyanobacterium]|jgi:hypothetical protein
MLSGSQDFLLVSILRLLQVFRILKLRKYLQESVNLRRAIVASRRNIFVFLMKLVILIGALTYLIEGESGGVNVPVGIHWAVVTVTTLDLRCGTGHPPRALRDLDRDAAEVQQGWQGAAGGCPLLPPVRHGPLEGRSTPGTA